MSTPGPAEPPMSGDGGQTRPAREATPPARRTTARQLEDLPLEAAAPENEPGVETPPATSDGERTEDSTRSQ
jgi:hypothetical protein